MLTCRRCNRGECGKFAQVPAIPYLERLRKRNEFLINSHHPLRETIINQMGKSEEVKISCGFASQEIFFWVFAVNL